MRLNRFVLLTAVVALAGCRPSQADANKHLFDACAAKSLDGVKAALREGADVNVPRRDPSFGFSPIEMATDSPEIVAELLKQGAAPKKAGAQGFLPLGVAAVSGKTESVELILKAGALLEGKDSDGETALAQAVAHGRLDNAQFLISCGANANTKDRHGFTPLMLLVNAKSINSLDRTELARLLIAHGADIKIKDAKGRTAASYADTTMARATGVSQDLIDLLKMPTTESH